MTLFWCSIAAGLGLVAGYIRAREEALERLRKSPDVLAVVEACEADMAFGRNCGCGWHS